MRLRSVVVFILAVALSLLAAGYKFYDSSHAIGLLSAQGGKARHPFHLDPGKNLYTLIATGTVLPPYRGDARVVLEGAPAMAYAIHDSIPIIDLEIHRRPYLKDGIMHDLQPRDRIALWVVMRPKEGPVLSSGVVDTPLDSSCCWSPDMEGDDAPVMKQADSALTLSFYDTKTNQPVLKIPVAFN